MQEEGAVGAQFLRGTAVVLAAYALELAGRPGGRIALPLKGIEQLLDARHPAGAPLPVELANDGIRHCLALARFIRSRGGIGPGVVASGPGRVGGAGGRSRVARGLETELAVDLLDELLADDVQGPDLLEVFVCAVAQLLVEVDPLDPPDVQQSRVDELIAAVKGELADGRLPAGGPRPRPGGDRCPGLPAAGLADPRRGGRPAGAQGRPARRDGQRPGLHRCLRHASSAPAWASPATSCSSSSCQARWSSTTCWRVRRTSAVHHRHGSRTSPGSGWSAA